MGYGSIISLTVCPSIQPMTAKMEVLDMVIDILVDHEKTMDKLIERLEQALTRQEKLEDWR